MEPVLFQYLYFHVLFVWRFTTNIKQNTINILLKLNKSWRISNSKLFIQFSWHFLARNWIKIQDWNSTWDNVSFSKLFLPLLDVSVTNKNRLKHFSLTPLCLCDTFAIWSKYITRYCPPGMFYFGGIKFFCPPLPGSQGGWSQTVRIVNSQVLSLYRLRNYRFVTTNKTSGHPGPGQSSSEPDRNIDKYWQARSDHHGSGKHWITITKPLMFRIC